MKTVNFKELELRSLSGETEKADAREFLGEMIYARVPGLRAKLLAEKIYKSCGDVELSDEEEGALREIAESGLFSGKLCDAILAALGRDV